jgi:hypothetical protein
MNDNDLPKQPEIVPQDSLETVLDRGAEPFWIQDVRIAQRRIEAQRKYSRSALSDNPIDLPGVNL